MLEAMGHACGGNVSTSSGCGGGGVGRSSNGDLAQVAPEIQHKWQKTSTRERHIDYSIKYSSRNHRLSHL